MHEINVKMQNNGGEHFDKNVIFVNTVIRLKPKLCCIQIQLYVFSLFEVERQVVKRVCLFLALMPNEYKQEKFHFHHCNCMNTTFYQTMDFIES